MKHYLITLESLEPDKWPRTKETAMQRSVENVAQLSLLLQGITEDLWLAEVPGVNGHPASICLKIAIACARALGNEDLWIDLLFDPLFDSVCNTSSELTATEIYPTPASFLYAIRWQIYEARAILSEYSARRIVCFDQESSFILEICIILTNYMTKQLQHFAAWHEEIGLGWQTD
jgi:hypothetical protein